MRLRDIGGIIVVDFIDMVLESNRDLVLRRLTECLGRDRTRHQVSEVTSLGLVQMTRKRIGAGLLEAFSTHLRALQRPRRHRARRAGRRSRSRRRRRSARGGNESKRSAPKSPGRARPDQPAGRGGRRVEAGCRTARAEHPMARPARWRVRTRQHAISEHGEPQTPDTAASSRARATQAAPAAAADHRRAADGRGPAESPTEDERSGGGRGRRRPTPVRTSSREAGTEVDRCPDAEGR